MKFCHTRKKDVYIYKLNFFILYILLILNIQLHDIYLNYKLNLFDINHDSIFSILEQTKEQQKYFSLVINDSGRNLVFIWGLIFAAISTILLYLIKSIVRWLKPITHR